MPFLLPFLTQLLVGVGMQIVGYMLTGAVNAEKPKKPSLHQFKEPTADPARIMPIMFGTVVVTGPNILWAGENDIKTRYIKMDKK